jgi:general secretion pathway protein L
VVEVGPVLAQPRQHWQLFTGMAARLRPACWILVLALALQAMVTVVKWSALADEKQELRAQMELRFRTVFPEAVAVMDPVLQMRRQLASAREAAGTVDSSDFLPLLERAALATTVVPEGSLLLLTYENARLTLEYSGAARIDIPRLQEDLRQSGLIADISPAATDSTRLVVSVRSI